MLLSATLIAPPLHAVERNVDVMPTAQIVSLGHDSDVDAGSDNIKSAALCAMDLMPTASNIYYSVSPKVEGDSNLRKLVKKHIRPKVFSGKLSIKSARKHAQAASICLKLLKQENQSAELG